MNTEIKTGTDYKVTDLCTNASKNRHHHTVADEKGTEYKIGHTERRKFLNLKNNAADLAKHPSRNGTFGNAIKQKTLLWSLNEDRQIGVFRIVTGGCWDEGSFEIQMKKRGHDDGQTLEM